jgi:uncharacterized protein YndB with AHSA1/START domain
MLAGLYAAVSGGGITVEVDGSRSFDVTADVLWAVVADPARLPDWVPTMRAAEPSGQAEVRLEGESHGHRYSLTSSLRADEDGRQLHWGAPAHEGYGGWLRVVDQPPGSEVHIHVAIPDERIGHSGGAAEEIRAGLDEALNRLAALIPD